MGSKSTLSQATRLHVRQDDYMSGKMTTTFSQATWLVGSILTLAGLSISAAPGPFGGALVRVLLYCSTLYNFSLKFLQ